MTPIGQTGGPGPAATRRCRWRALAWVALCLVVLAALAIGARLALPALLTGAVQRQLVTTLAVPVQTGIIRLELLDGRATIQGLTVGQPDGFGSAPFLVLQEVTVRVSPWPFRGVPQTIDEVVLTGLAIHLVRDQAGTLNAVCLLRPVEKPGEAGLGRPLHIRRITIRDLALQYTDSALGEAPLDLHFGQVEAVITDVHLAPAPRGEAALPGRAELTAHLSQTGFAAAPLGLVARFGYLDPKRTPPPTLAALRLAGLELQPLDAFVSRGLPTAMGGDIADLSLDVALSPELLDCTVDLVTPASKALSLKVGGTPRQPLVEPGGWQALLGDRAGEAGLNILKDAGGSGADLGRTALSLGTDTGRGAGSTLAGILKGLFRSAANLSRGEVSAAGSSLRDTASSAVTGTADMLERAPAHLAAGARHVGSVFRGGDRDAAWRADIQRRWAENWAAARQSVAQRSFPPAATDLAGADETQALP